MASKSHVARERFAALTALLQSEKLILPRSGEALTLRVSPRGFLKASTGGRPSGRPYPYTITRMHAASCQTLQTGQRSREDDKFDDYCAPYDRSLRMGNSLIQRERITTTKG